MRRFHLLLSGALIACARAPEQTTTRPESVQAWDTAAPVESVTTSPIHAIVKDRGDSLDLSGRWITGASDEPTAREIRYQRDCRYTPGAWLLDQSGDSVYAWPMKEQWAKGTASPPEPMPRQATGRLRKHHLILSDGSDRWVLDYDGRSGHLRGTLNGKPFWAMRQILEEPKEQCIPVP